MPYSFQKDTVDYTLYLVTDSTMLPPDTTLLSQVHASLKGGATIVQLREKTMSTADFIRQAEEVHTLTQQFGVPLIINDRVDVALAVGAEGVHVGQDDMSAEKVRQLIGPEKLLGVSTRDLDELSVAIDSGLVDYVGIGALFGTSTKQLDRPPMGPRGAQSMLARLEGTGVKSVLIGGLNERNVVDVIKSSTTPSGFTTDGVAVVSCIMASPTAEEATVHLSSILRLVYSVLSTSQLIKRAPPLVHHLTNNVVKNLSANVTLAIGASPIMSESPEEFDDLSNIPTSCLVLNTGTVSQEMEATYLRAIHYYTLKKRPIVYDPVGCGASRYRKELNGRLLKHLHGPNVVIKGNASEILTLAGVDVKQRGVDGDSTLSSDVLINAAASLSLIQDCTVVITGADDIIYNANVAPFNQGVIIKSGHPIMGKITGSGCSLGSVIASFVQASGSSHKDVAEAASAAVHFYGEAGALAARNTNGPGSFVPEFLDKLYLS